MEHLKRLWHTPKHGYDSPQELTGCVTLAGVKDVCGLLRHGAREGGGAGTTTVQGVHG